MDLGSTNSSHFDGSWVIKGFSISNSLSTLVLSSELLAILASEKETISSACTKGIELAIN